MQFQAESAVILDYLQAANTDILENISGVSVHADLLWTVSDELRTLECLARGANGYTLLHQTNLDDVLPDLPGDAGDELDLEAIDVVDGTVWICGSHCRVRKKPDTEGIINPKLRTRTSRHVLAALETDGAGRITSGAAIPFEGPGSLREVLADDPYLRPFIDLPSKENGLDIEGMVATPGGVLLGLRGPLVDNAAVVVRLGLDGLAIERANLSFLDLGGLAIRDLARAPGGLLVLAGPVSDARGPFRLYYWSGASGSSTQVPKLVWEWPAGLEKPEGICVIEEAGRVKLLVVYDRPEGRVQGTKYRADIATLPPLV
jgi:hypothetical protein